MNAGEVHDGFAIGDQGRAWSMLYFEPAVVAEAALDLSEGRSSQYEFVEPVSKTRGPTRLVTTLFNRTISSREDLSYDELLLRALSLLGRQHDLACSKYVSPGVQRARELIDDDPTIARSLDGLAGHCGLTKFQVLRGFSKAYGLTPHAYMVQKRIQIARRQMAQGTRLAEIAAMSGFADQSHMTRIFVRTYGITPHAYARAVRSA